MRSWAFFRRLQYGTGFGLFWVFVFAFVYMHYFYQTPSCYDNSQNGDELGVDCGGSCTRICAFQAQQPTVDWARSFRVTDGQYNAVAYIENRNKMAASPQVQYTFSLYDTNGLITKRSGTTILPPDSVYPVFESRIDTGTRVPTQTFIDLQPVQLWVPAQTGSGQFTVLDRTLSRADSQPRLEATLYNNALTTAKRVEVVATIFDTRGNALTASRTYVDDFAGRSKQTVVFTWPEPIAKTLRSCEVPTDVLLAVDVSGSMNDDGGDPPQPITSVLTSAESFVDRLRTSDQAGVVSFATDASLIEPLTSTLENVKQQIAALHITPKEEHGSTNTGDALAKALQELDSSHHNTDARKVVVLLTDGLATAPADDPQQYALDQAQKLKDDGITIYTIGLGENVNMDFVKALASSPTQAYKALSAAQVDSIYKTITTDICEAGPAVINIVPKTNASFAKLQQ